MTPAWYLVPPALAVAVLLWPTGSAGKRLDRVLLPRPRGSPEATVPETSVPRALVLDLVAAVLDGGAAPAVAVALIADSLDAVADPAADFLRQLSGLGSAGRPSGTPDEVSGVSGGTPDTSGGAFDDWSVLAEALSLAQRTGIAPAGLVRSAARQERHRLGTARALAARRLAVHVVIPTAACLLPAFVLFTIVPLILDLLTGL
ncbi:MAG: hypothetical protein P8Z68_02270 [Kineosporiaceae bacterium]